MGNCNCSQADAPVAADNPAIVSATITSSPAVKGSSESLDKELAKAVKELSEKRVEKPQTFTSLLLKFPDLHKGFDKCREVFKACDSNHDDHITLAEMQQGLSKCGFSETGDKDTIMAIFESSHFDKNHTIDFKEFIVALAVLYVLKKCKGLPIAGLDPQILHTFKTVLDSFLFFDKDKAGILSKAHVLTGMQDSDKHEQMISRSSMELPEEAVTAPSVDSSLTDRFEELDWNCDGTIAFKEFMFALEGWVLSDEEE